MNPIVVHLWGVDGAPSLVSPESVAVYWLLNGYSGELFPKDAGELQIVFSNNVDVSPRHELPVLVDERCGERVCGFVRIAQYLSQGWGTKQLLLDNALLEYTQDKLVALTEYQLFLEKTNYENFTRKQYSKMLYWPMWNIVPLQERARVRAKCDKAIGYLPHSDDVDFLEYSGGIKKLEDEIAETAINMTQSKTFKVTNQLKQRNKEELRAANYSLQFKKKLEEFLKTWIQLRERLNFKDVKIVDLLMWANIYVQLNLPNGEAIKTHLANTISKEFMESLSRHLDACSKFKNEVPQRNAFFKEQGNPLNVMYSYARNYI